MLPRLLTIVALTTLLAPATAPADAEEISVAVMEFSSKGGIEQDKMDALSDMLANEIRAQGPYKVVGKSDIQAALAMEEQKQLLGCSDESCIAEIGGALGVRWIIVGNVSLFGKTYLLNLKLLDVTAIKVLAGVSKKISGGEDMLIDGLGAAAQELLQAARSKLGLADAGDEAGDPAGDGQPAGGSGGGGALTSFGPGDAGVSASAPSTFRSYSTWGHVTFWAGAGLTLVGLGGAAFGKVRGDVYNDWDKPRDDRVEALDDSRLGAALMYAGLFSGVALMTTGVLLWVLGPDDEPEESTPGPEAGIGFGPAPGNGALVGVTGRW